METPPFPCPTWVSCTRVSRGLEVGHCHEEIDQGGQSWKEKIGSIIDQSNLPGLSVSSHITNSKANTHPQLPDPWVILVTQKTGRKAASCLRLISAEDRTHLISYKQEREGERAAELFCLLSTTLIAIFPCCWPNPGKSPPLQFLSSL